METESGKILFAEVDSHPRNSSTYPPAMNWSAYATSITPFPGPKNSFRGFISRDEFNFTKLSESAGNLTVCQKELCCHLSYRMLAKEGDEVYVLGAFAGLHGRRRREYWQVISTGIIHQKHNPGKHVKEKQGWEPAPPGKSLYYW